MHILKVILSGGSNDFGDTNPSHLCHPSPPPQNHQAHPPRKAVTGALTDRLYGCQAGCLNGLTPQARSCTGRPTANPHTRHGDQSRRTLPLTCLMTPHLTPSLSGRKCGRQKTYDNIPATSPGALPVLFGTCTGAGTPSRDAASIDRHLNCRMYYRLENGNGPTSSASNFGSIL